jgi:Zn-dependent peptidase ImmA (M78 family)
VTTWTDAHLRAATLAAETHADLGISLDQPVDVFGAIEKLGLVLAFADLGKVSGLYIPGGASIGIMIHSGHPRTRQRYTAGHELGHHVFSHGTDIDIDLEGALRRNPSAPWLDHEKEAEAFGAWFLMPRRLIRRGLQELEIAEISSPYDVYALSLWLGTSYTATARQLGATRLVTSAQATEWAKIPPRTIKRSLAGTFVPNDLRNDVWWLRRQQDGSTIEARPGDRVVLSLDEIPSSGFSWRLEDLSGRVHQVADSFVDEIDADRGVTLDSGDLDEEQVGGTCTRTFVFEIPEYTLSQVENIDLVKDQPWDPSSPRERMSITVSVIRPLSGIQIPEAAFRLAS